MDPEEGGALAAARAPLVQESDPQSPGSPFSRLLSTTSRAEDELFRTARRAVVLRDFGGVFQDQYEFLRSAVARRRARYPCSRCVDGVIAAVWQGRREDSQHAIAAKTQETV